MKLTINLITLLIFGSTLSINVSAQDAEIAKSNGIFTEKTGGYEEAALYFEEAIKLYSEQNITDSCSIYHAGLNYSRIKQYQKAIPYLEQSLKIGYRPIRATKMLAKAYSKTKENEKSEKLLLAAKEKYPNEPDFDKTLAYLYFNSAQYEKAVTFFSSLNQKSPGKKNYMYLYGFSLERTGQYKQAANQFQKLCEKFPNYEDGAKMLGISLFEYAENQNKTAVSGYNSKGNPTLDEYLVVHNKLKDIDKYYEDARLALEKAFTILPNDKQIINALYKVYKKQSKDSKAAEMKKIL